MKWGGAVASIASATLVLSACWGDEDATHRTPEGTGALHDPATDCIWIFQTDGDKEVAPRIGEPVEDCIPPETTTTTVAPATTQPVETIPPDAADGDFIESFDANTGLDRFRRGVYHRDTDAFGFPLNPIEWTGDHDLECGSPDTQRTLNKADKTGVFYTCRDHLMSSVGAVDGYSLAWFAPDQTFTAANTTVVSWDVNVTDLLARQWWEVALVDPAAPDLIAHPTVAGIDGDGAHAVEMVPYPEGSVVVGNGPFARGPIKINGNNPPESYGDWWRPICGPDFALDPEGCASKAIRRTFTLTDNRNGSITVDFLDKSWTVAGSFPSEFKVLFKDHNYTPDKDGDPVGHTWHWDNIALT